MSCPDCCLSTRNLDLGQRPCKHPRYSYSLHRHRRSECRRPIQTLRNVGKRRDQSRDPRGKYLPLFYRDSPLCRPFSVTTAISTLVSASTAMAAARPILVATCKCQLPTTLDSLRLILDVRFVLGLCPPSSSRATARKSSMNCYLCRRCHTTHVCCVMHVMDGLIVDRTRDINSPWQSGPLSKAPRLELLSCPLCFRFLYLLPILSSLLYIIFGPSPRIPVRTACCITSSNPFLPPSHG